MASLVENLGKELEQLDKEYASEFAGQSRMTRELGNLDAIIKRAQSILQRVDQIPSAAQGSDLVRLRDAAAQSLELYKAERQAIARAQEVGPVFEQFSLEATGANLAFARYARHFAGKDRTSRDASLLGELVDELKSIEKRMTELLDDQPSPDFDRDREVVRENIKQYKNEIDLIETAQSTGTDEEHASILAVLANNQFQTYQIHFAGEPRVSRRPALIMRVTGALKKIRERMGTLKDAGLEADYNMKNIAIVEDRLKTYEAELAEIRKVRQGTQMSDIMGELGGSANRLFDEYRAIFADKPRAQADTERLGSICDKLAEIRRQMVDLSRAEDSDMNVRNLDIVTEQLVMFEGEFEAVMRAKNAQPK